MFKHKVYKLIVSSLIAAALMMGSGVAADLIGFSATSVTYACSSGSHSGGDC